MLSPGITYKIKPFRAYNNNNTKIDLEIFPTEKSEINADKYNNFNNLLSRKKINVTVNTYNFSLIAYLNRKDSRLHKTEKRTYWVRI
jgi:hypothetical protein